MENMDVNFWKNKKVLITGHTGFKGSWLSLMLAKEGALITGYSLPAPTTPNMFDLCNIDSKIYNNIIGDVNNLHDLKKAVQGQDIVFHLAAQALVLESYKNPIYTLQTNIMGTANLLEACRDAKIQTVVVITSDKCYENKEWFWGYRENDNLGGFDPYSTSKACAEHVANTYRTAYNLNVATCRAGNVIGGGDWGNYRLIPNLIRSIDSKESLIIRKPKATRPWQHVLDPLSGYINLAERLHNNKNYSQAWNFAPTNVMDVSVKDLISHLQMYLDFEFKVEENENDPYEARNLKLDCFKAINLLDWRCIWNVEKALEKTADWYKCYFNQEGSEDRLYIKTMSQIEEHHENSLCS